MEGLESALWGAGSPPPSERPPKPGESSAAILSSAGADVGVLWAGALACAPPNPNSVCPNFEGPAVPNAPKPPEVGVVSKADFPA